MALFEEQLDYFMDSLKSGRLAHGFIFSGEQTQGEVLRCVQHIFCGQEHSACGSCSSCLKFSSNNLADFMEVLPEGASIKNHQIEEVQNYMVIKPFECDYKVVLIHQADLMTEQAQNRLLKILEEPPEYAIFIFETQKVEQILDTVKSRCQIFTISSRENRAFEEDIKEKCLQFLMSLYKKDTAAILELSVYAKKEKEAFVPFLQALMVLIRDVLCYKETNDLELVHDDYKRYFNSRDQIGKIIHNFNSKDLLIWIFEIDQVQNKIKSNMNYDLTVDSFLMRCLK